MANIAIDATYTVDPNPTGVAVYSRKLIESLATLETAHRFLVCYRLSRIGQRRRFLRPAQPQRPRGQLSPGGPSQPDESRGPSFSVKLFQEPFTFWLPWQARLFHSLAQRPPAFRFEKEIVTIHDIFPITGRDYSTPEFQRKFSLLLVEAAERAARVITPSQYTADQLVERVGTSWERIRVIPEGVDLPASFLTPEERLRERELLVGKGHEMILSVGVLDNRKNVLNALRALAGLPERCRMVLAGGNGHGSEAIHELIRKESFGSRVTVLGHVGPERLPALYQAASVLLFPSFEEGFGLPVLEAMAHGLPVVAAKTSSLPEVGGDAALYLDPNAPPDIAEKLLSVIENPAMREKMIQSGFARARQFTWRRTAELTLKVYDELLAK